MATDQTPACVAAGAWGNAEQEARKMGVSDAAVFAIPEHWCAPLRRQQAAMCDESLCAASTGAAAARPSTRSIAIAIRRCIPKQCIV